MCGGVGGQLGAVAVVLGLGTVACGDDNASSDNPPPTPIPFDPPPSSCDVPLLPPALPTNTVVGSGTADSCTEAALRDALEVGGNVTFECGGAAVTIPLASEILIKQDAIIDGGGLVTLDGGGSTRIFHTAARVALVVRRLNFVRGQATETEGELASGGAVRVGWLGTLGVYECTFGDNHAANDGIEGGGAIYQSNGGELVVVDSTFTGNSAVSGGAIDNLLSPMTLIGSTFVDNESFAGGGAVYDDGASTDTEDDEGGTINICGCRFERNLTEGQGGGVYLWAYPPDRFIIGQSIFRSNRVTRPSDGSALGGALSTGNAPLQLLNSAFIENHAEVHGGAYWTRGAHPAQISNSTFYRNQAGVEGVDDAGYGGALSGFNMVLSHLTLVQNHAVFSGGAIYNEEDFTLDDSILANNTAGNPWGNGQSCIHVMPGSGNVQWPASTSDSDPPCTEDAVAADPLLGDLSNNGGATETIPLLDGSPALDLANDCTLPDQRGEPRQSPCDSGAFERP